MQTEVSGPEIKPQTQIAALMAVCLRMLFVKTCLTTGSLEERRSSERWRSRFPYLGSYAMLSAGTLPVGLWATLDLYTFSEPWHTANAASNRSGLRSAAAALGIMESQIPSPTSFRPFRDKPQWPTTPKSLQRSCRYVPGPAWPSERCSIYGGLLLPSPQEDAQQELLQ